MKETLLKFDIGGLKLSISAVFTAVAALFNKVPTLLILFMAAVAIDYLTGWAKAAFFLKEWNSQTGLQGIIKKSYVLCIDWRSVFDWLRHKNHRDADKS